MSEVSRSNTNLPRQPAITRAQFAALLAALPDAMLITNRAGTIVATNSLAAQLFGYAPEQLVGQPLKLLLPARLRSTHQEHAQRYMANPQTRQMGVGLDLVAQHADGDELPVDVSLSPLYLEDELFIISTIRDMRERRQAEATLRRQAQHTAMLEAFSLSLAKLHHDYDQLRRVVVEELGALTGHACVLALLSTDGQWLTPVASYHPSPAGAALLQHALVPARVSVRLQRLLRAGVPRVYSCLDSRRHCMFISPKAWRDQTTSVAASCLIIPLKAQDQIIGALELLRASAEQPFTETERQLVQALAERAAPALLTAALFHALQRELHERARLEAQLAQLQKLDMLGRFAASIAHDFNNFLTVIHSAVELAQIQLPESSPAAADLQLAQATVTRAISLTQQLLMFAHRQPYAPKLYNVNQLIAEVKALLDKLVGAEVQIVLRLAPGLGLVNIDPGQLEQVLINLVVNARDAMPQGGLIRIETKLLLLRQDQAYLLPTEQVLCGPCVCVSVTDTGAGMDEMVREHLFEPFFTTKGPGQGTGLGLATSYGILTRHGGTIQVESMPGAGTTITLILPQATEQPAGEPGLDTSSEPGLDTP